MADTTPVINVQDFKKKYGTKKPGQLVMEFVRLSPEFPPETFDRGAELCREMGVMFADLESALRDVEVTK